MKRLAVSAAMMLFAVTGQAAGWSDLLSIERAFTENSDLLVIYTSGGSGVFSQGCEANTWIFVANSETRRARAWATILTAQATGQKVQLWFTDNCTTWGFHETTAIMLHKP